MTTEIVQGEATPALVTGTNGPYMLAPNWRSNLVVWYNLGSATSIAINYSQDGGVTWSPIPMSVPAGSSSSSHYENTNTITGNLGQIQVVVTGSVTGASWGIN